MVFAPQAEQYVIMVLPYLSGDRGVRVGTLTVSVSS